MSRILEASCTAGVVTTAPALPVVAAAILSEGVGPSSGILVLDQDRAFYVAKISPDLKTALENVASALGSIATALSALDAKPTGTLPAAPVAAASITAISTIQTALTALKEALR